MSVNREMEDAAPFFYSSVPLPRSPLPPRTRKKKNQEERSTKLSRLPANQSAPCTLDLSSGLDIEEGSAAAAAAASAACCVYVYVCVCEGVCVRGSLMK